MVLGHSDLYGAVYHIVIPKNGLNCTVHCDSLAALQRVQNSSYDRFETTWRCRANYDLEAAIKFCLGDLPIHIQ